VISQHIIIGIVEVGQNLIVLPPDSINDVVVRVLLE